MWGESGLRIPHWPRELKDRIQYSYSVFCLINVVLTSSNLAKMADVAQRLDPSLTSQYRLRQIALVANDLEKAKHLLVGPVSAQLTQPTKHQDH